MLNGMSLTLSWVNLERHSQTLTKETTGFDSSYQELLVPLLGKKLKYLLMKGRGWEGHREREGWETVLWEIFIYFFSSLFPFLGHVLNSF